MKKIISFAAGLITGVLINTLFFHSFPLKEKLKTIQFSLRHYETNKYVEDGTYMIEFENNDNLIDFHNGIAYFDSIPTKEKRTYARFFNINIEEKLLPDLIEYKIVNKKDFSKVYKKSYFNIYNYQKNQDTIKYDFDTKDF